METPSKSSRRKRLTLQEKFQALRMLEGGSPPSAVMSKFGVSSRFVRKLKGQGVALLEEAKRNSISMQSKCLSGAQHPYLDAKVYRFVELARSCNIPVTQNTIRERALLTRDGLLRRDDLENSQRAQLKRFMASAGWYANFVKRHGIRSVALHGQAASATVKEEAADMAKLRERLLEFDADCIYNVDETALFYRLLPRRSYVTRVEDKKTLRGTRQMSAKDRITAYICMNADGSEKVPLAIIGNAEKPRCFRLGRPPVTYFSDDTAWSNSETFKKWFIHVFLPHVRSRTSKKVALLVDSPSWHFRLCDGDEQVTLIALPPKAVHRPMNSGIIGTWKQTYRKLLVQELVRDLESLSERREANRGRMDGMNGLEEGFDPHMLDAANLAKLSWENVSSMTIARCWVEAQCLPTAMNAEISAAHGEMRSSTSDSDVRNVVRMLSRLKLNLDESDGTSIDGNIVESEVKQWFDVENDADVREAMVSDVVHEMDQRMTGTPAQEIQENEIGDEVNDVTAPPPPLPDLYAMFRPIQEAAFSSNLPDASALLQRALNVFREADRKSNATGEREMAFSESVNKRS